MKKRYLVMIIIGCVGLVLVLSMATIVHLANRQMETLMTTNIQEVALHTLEDGTYHGRVRTIPITAEVNVVIKDQTIIEIVLLKHRHGEGFSAEEILEQITYHQSLQVDAVAGATYSSQAILLAIERALKD